MIARFAPNKFASNMNPIAVPCATINDDDVIVAGVRFLCACACGKFRVHRNKKNPRRVLSVCACVRECVLLLLINYGTNLRREIKRSISGIMMRKPGRINIEMGSSGFEVCACVSLWLTHNNHTFIAITTPISIKVYGVCTVYASKLCDKNQLFNK